jgi:hypothetical protein
MSSSADTLGIAFPSSDRDNPDCRASDLESAVVSVPDSSTHFPWARNGTALV